MSEQPAQRSQPLCDVFPSTDVWREFHSSAWFQMCVLAYNLPRNPVEGMGRISTGSNCRATVDSAGTTARVPKCCEAGIWCQNP